MKIIKKISIAFLLFWAFSNTAQAATFSQTNVTLSVGQSVTVYAYNISNSLYISNNSNSNIATVSMNGNNLSIYGNNSGSTSVTVCENGSYGCTSIYITVNGSNNNGNLSLSQTSLTLSVGQTSTITATNYYFNYASLYVSSNSNPNVATASVTNNNTISIYAKNTGSTTLTICQSSGSSLCSSVYVYVTGGYNYPSSSNLGFVLSNLILSIGDSLTLSAPNPGSGGLSILSNSNPTVLLASPSTVSPGCVLGSYYSTITGLPCYYGYGGVVANSQYTNSSYVAGCTPGALYNIYTGQPCYGGGYNSQSNSLTISAISLGQSTITVCQTNAICSAITVSVTR